jgi:hypothetical protein
MITSQADRHALVTKLNTLIANETNNLIRSEENGDQRRGKIAAYQSVIELVTPKEVRQPIATADYGFGERVEGTY